jgi:hypothetical protein
VALTLPSEITPLQAAWWPTRSALDEARRELDADAYQAFVSMLTVVVARLNAELVEREWRAAA